MKRTNVKHQRSKSASSDSDKEICVRLFAAERALKMLAHEQLPFVRKFIFNASFDLRNCIKKKKIKKTLDYIRGENQSSKESKSGGYVKLSLTKENLTILLFYDHMLSANEAILFSRSLGEIVAVTYAALGLDMSGVASISSDSCKGSK